MNNQSKMGYPKPLILFSLDKAITKASVSRASSSEIP